MPGKSLTTVNASVAEQTDNAALSVDVLQQSKEILNLVSDIQIFNSDGKVNSLIDIGFPGGNRLPCYFFKINKLSYDEDYPHREALENVIMALDNEAFNFVYLLEGTEEGVSLYLGVVKNHHPNQKDAQANDYGQLIEKVFEGNFNGSELERLKNNTIRNIIIGGAQKFTEAQSENGSLAGVIVGIPSVNEREAGDAKDFQGMDRLINSMLGLNWRLAIVCEPMPTAEVVRQQADIYELYNRLYVSSKLTRQKSVNDGKTITFGENSSETRSKNWGTNKSDSHGTSRGRQSSSSNSGSSDTHTYGTTDGASESKTTGTNKSTSVNKGSSDAVTIEMANKHAMELMKYIDEELLERIRLGISKGMYNTSVFYMADRPAYANRLKNAVISLFQGNKSTHSPLIAKELSPDDVVKGILGDYQNQMEDVSDLHLSKDIPILYGRPYRDGVIGLSTLLTLEEVSLLAGLPQQEVPGLSLVEGVEFGLNSRKAAESIRLGNVVQRGRVLEKVPFDLNRKSISKHVFIAGVTGSGKTTTCHRMLEEASMPFMVIEPAKTEYRTLINHPSFKDITVFTLGNETIAPFRLNPFEIVEGENISSHIDMIKATFTAAFPMEGSMPQMLEEAIYLSYEKKGWDIENNRHKRIDDPFHTEEPCYPVISDLLNNMSEVVKAKNFGDRMQSEYLGSLVSRLSNLTVGAKGRMLNCDRSVDFNYLADHNVILELEDLKNPEDKSLFMGFILSRLSAVIKNKHKQNPDYKHVTLVEESHRLLSKVEYGDSGSKKTSVETFTDLLAEVRKYGEGLIIVDQIPNKLAPDVLKNTNTKIVHRIFARDDKEAIGDTMMMDDKQKEFLSSLPIGHTIIFAENTDRPIHVAIAATSNTNEAEISDEVVRKRFLANKEHYGSCYDEFGMFLQEAYAGFTRIFIKNRPPVFDRETYSFVEKKVAEAVQQFGMPESEVWLRLVERYYRLTGKSEAAGADVEKFEKDLADVLLTRCAMATFEEEMKNDMKFALQILALL